MSDVSVADAASNAKAASRDVSGYALQHDVVRNLICREGRHPDIASPHDWYMALAFSVRDRMQ
jgi:starch phosphorylase